MSAKAKKINEGFSKDIEKQYKELLTLYNKIVSKKPDQLETFRRKKALNYIKDERKKFYKLSNSDRTQYENVHFTMRRRYRDYMTECYPAGEVRFYEWYTDDWDLFFNQEYNIDIQHNENYKFVHSWSMAQAAQFVAKDIAFEKVEIQHHNLMDQLRESKEQEQLILNNTTEEADAKTSAYTTKQATVAILTIFNSHTPDSLEIINKAALCELIHRLTGKSKDNISGHITSWSKGTLKNYYNDLEPVVADLRKIGLSIDVNPVENIIDDSFDDYTNTK